MQCWLACQWCLEYGQHAAAADGVACALITWLPCAPVQAREGQLKQLPHLLEARANGLGGLELGCLIGLGSYGKVYKGAAHRLHVPARTLVPRFLVRWRAPLSLEEGQQCCLCDSGFTYDIGL